MTTAKIARWFEVLRSDASADQKKKAKAACSLRACRLEQTDEWHRSPQGAEVQSALESYEQALRRSISGRLIQLTEKAAAAAIKTQANTDELLTDELLQRARGKIPQKRFYQTPDARVRELDVALASVVSWRAERNRAAKKKKKHTSAQAQILLLAPMTAEEEEHLLAQLEDGGSERVKEKIRGQVVRLSLDRHGCRVIQRALDEFSGEDKLKIVEELKGSVKTLIESPHGNFVVQKVVEVLTESHSNFVAEELRGIATATAKHRFGCRILCRLGEHHLSLSGNQACATKSLFTELLAEAENLMTHPFARYVLESAIEFGGEGHRQTLVDLVALDPYKYAFSRCGSFILEKILKFGNPTDINRVGIALLQDAANFTQLLQHRHGAYVAKTLILAGDICRSSSAEKTKQRILRMARLLQTSAHGDPLYISEGQVVVAHTPSAAESLATT